MAGYSKRSLVDKLGIKPGASVLFVGAPRGYAKALGTLPEGAAVTRSVRPRLDFIQLFTTRRADLERRFGDLQRALAPAGMLWVSWPKQASGVTTDVTGDVVRGVALARGLVDVKVCAIDDVWSGLKLVRRVKDR
jgi:hypothetical protein